jgi:glycosyltransferase involved in cell wall biosynthesis
MKNLLYIGNQLKHNTGTITSIDSLGALLENEGYSIAYASSKNIKIYRLMDMMLAVLKSRKNVDYVLIDTYSTLNFYYAFLVSQLCRVLNLKYIPILHGGNLPHRLEQNPKLSNLIFNNAYKNISPSNYMKSEFDRLDYSNTICIPNSIEISKYPFGEKDFKSIRLLWVRSFSEIYNPMLAVTILKSLQDQGFSAELCMIGPEKDGSLNQCKKYAKELNVDVYFPGKLSKPEWVKLSSHYNIFINTTNYDNMPVSVIEAMALGFPIISTNVGGMPFLIDHHKDGVLVNPNDANGFVKEIKSLISNPEKAIAVGNSARTKAESFDWNLIKQQWMAIFK